MRQTAAKTPPGQPLGAGRGGPLADARPRARRGPAAGRRRPRGAPGRARRAARCRRTAGGGGRSAAVSVVSRRRAGMARLVTATWSPIQTEESRVKSRLGSGSMTKSCAVHQLVDQPAAGRAARRGRARRSATSAGPRGRGRRGGRPTRPAGCRRAAGRRARRRSARRARGREGERLGEQIGEVEHLDAAVAQRLRRTRRAPPARGRPTGCRRRAASRCCAG